MISLLVKKLKTVWFYFHPDNKTLTAYMFKGAGGTLALKLLYTVMLFLITILLARTLGVEQFGLYTFALSWVLLAGVLAQAGMGQLLTKNIAAYHAESDFPHIKGILQYSFVVVAAISILILLGAMGVSWLLVIDSQMQVAMYLALILIPLQALLAPASGAQSGFQQVVKAQLPVQLIQPGSFIILLLIIWMVFPAILSVGTVLSLLIFTTTVALLSAILFLKHSLPKEMSTVEPVYDLRKWSSSALSLVLAGGMFIINTNADIVMLGILADVDSAGIYKVATRGAELIFFVLAIVNIPLSPLISRLYTKKEFERLQKGITKSARIAFVLGVCIAIPLVLLNQWFMAIFGETFRSGGTALQILCIGQLFNVFSGSVGVILLMTGNEKMAAVFMFMAGALNICLNALLIPEWGINGAAIATAVSTAVWNAVMLYFIIRNLRINPTVLSWKIARKNQ